jgi:hypothetical protein
MSAFQMPTMLTKEQLQRKESNRCRHENDKGERDCYVTADFYECNEDGTSVSKEAYALRMCRAHKLEVQRCGSGLRKKYKKFLQKQHPGKGAQPKKKKLLKRKRPSRSQKSRSSSSASTTSSRSWNSSDSHSSSDSNYSFRVAGNCLNFVSPSESI